MNTKKSDSAKTKTTGEVVPINNAGPRMMISTIGDVESELARMPDVSKATCIKDASCMLLVAINAKDANDGWDVGFSFKAILSKTSEMFPHSESTEKCLRWYLVKIRQQLEGFERYEMKTRFKRPKSRWMAAASPQVAKRRKRA